jgi:hypothetical protein
MFDIESGTLLDGAVGKKLFRVVFVMTISLLT